MEARDAGADLVVLPELAISGYPPEDLLLRPGFLRAAHEALEAVARETTGIVALVGTPWLDRDLANACAVCADGRVAAVYRKHFLPNYGVFDEHRYFAAGRELVLLRLGEAHVGITICEDLWQPGPPATDLALAGAQLIVNLSASPFHVGKAEDREEMLVTRARDTSSYVAFCNLVGGQDELVFDGHSVVLDDAGEVVARAPGFEEHLLVVDVEPELAVGRRLRDVRRRELDRSRETAPAGRARRPRRAARATGGRERSRRALRAVARANADGARARPARLRGEERLHGRRRRRLRRHRLRRDRGTLRRRARCRASARRLDAVPLLVRRNAQRCRRARAQSRRRLPRDPDRGRCRRLRGVAARADGRRDRRARGREPAGARPRGDRHGSLEHVRLARRLDREQVGARGRVLDALRRHGRRIRAPQGRLQDRRVRAGAPPERASERPRSSR